MSTRAIVTSHPDVACYVCGRRLLRGEQHELFLVEGGPQTVCELCAPRAAQQGWPRGAEQQAPAEPVVGARRGRPQGMEPVGAMTEIKAEVPMAEMLTYAPDLRSITGGQGDYTLEFLRYEEVPAHLAQKVVEQAGEERAAAHA